jgi:hypothetical protein
MLAFPGHCPSFFVPPPFLAGGRGGDDFLSAVAEDDFDVLSDLLDDVDLLSFALSTEREASGTFQGRSWRSGRGSRLD